MLLSLHHCSRRGKSSLIVLWGFICRTRGFNRQSNFFSLYIRQVRQHSNNLSITIRSNIVRSFQRAFKDCPVFVLISIVHQTLLFTEHEDISCWNENEYILLRFIRLSSLKIKISHRGLVCH